MWSSSTQPARIYFVSREPASFFSFFYFFSSLLPLLLFFILFLFFFFFFNEKRKGDDSQSVRADLLLRGWEGRTNLSRDEISLENEVDDHVNRSSSILFYVCSIPLAESATRFTTTKSLTASTDPYQCSKLHHFQLKKLVKIYTWKL